MPKTSYISAVLQHIENHLMSSIDPVSIAKQHFISMSQLEGLVELAKIYNEQEKKLCQT